MQSHKRRRAPRTTIAQYALMLEFFTKHTILLNGRQTSTTRSATTDADKLWSKLTTSLNNCGSGASKSVDQWKRIWVEWKSNTKRRCREELIDHKNGVKVRGLTELEQRLIDLLNSVTTTDNSHIEITTSCKEEKNTSPLEVIEMLIENSDSNNITNDFEHMSNNFNTETVQPAESETPKDFSSACSVICNSLNGVALAIRELAASQCKMADANVKLADVIIKQMELTKK